ncbi:MAG: hypothetical protein K2K17_08240 [Lachnospiraceae bacterium]|nr:hypothetical protein [Lachnospiraceae bacterium]
MNDSMRIGGIGSFGLHNYRVSAVYGNPRSLQPVKKIGQETAYGDTTAVVEKTQQQPVQKETQDRLMKQPEAVNYQDIMNQMRTMTRFSADTIPMVSAI